MKTLVFNDTKLSPYLFDDSKNVGDDANPDFYIGDMNSSNATLYESVTAPSDWQGNRYTYDGTTWTEIDGWVDPTQAEIDRLEAEVVRLKAL